ncbi:MAG: C40 family peptidase [Actinobacteria bacterium]|nr:C40 family peptidase [Actinomycetota bacterium]
MRTGRIFLSVLMAAALLGALAPAASARKSVPAWAKEPVRYLKDQGLIDGSTFHSNKAMRRADFRALMKAAFGGGFSRTEGKVTAAEVDRALVKVLGKRAVSDHLADLAAPDGWAPKRPAWFGDEIVAREMGLRHDRPVGEDEYEASANEKLSQADIAYAVWRALTSPSTYGADALADLKLGNYDPKVRRVIQFAFSLAGTPYVYAGEWAKSTPAGYPYGAQAHGGVDCSGFVWYVLQKKSSAYSPPNRPYKGWAIPERSSAEMAKATKDRLGFGKLEPGDAMFFAADGRKSKPRDVYHAALYLGKGWMIHSSNGRAGVSISPIDKGSWWRSQFLFGRRVIK